MPSSATMKYSTGSNKTSYFIKKKPCFSFSTAIKQSVTHVVCAETGGQGLHRNLSNGHKSEQPSNSPFGDRQPHPTGKQPLRLGDGDAPRAVAPTACPALCTDPTWETAGMGR